MALEEVGAETATMMVTVNVPDTGATRDKKAAIPGDITVVVEKEVAAVDLDESNTVVEVEAGVVEVDVVPDKIMAKCWI